MAAVALSLLRGRRQDGSVRKSREDTLQLKLKHSRHVGLSFPVHWLAPACLISLFFLPN